jgi:hypothetical protein
MGLELQESRGFCPGQQDNRHRYCGLAKTFMVQTCLAPRRPYQGEYFREVKELSLPAGSRSPFAIFLPITTPSDV